MDISKYAGYFHDGYVNNIIHKGNTLEFFLESSVVDPSEIADPDRVILSRSNTLKGILLLQNIKTIKMGNKKYSGILQMNYDDGDILDLKIDNNKVFLLIEWKNFPPKTHVIDVSKIEIEAEKIQWIPEKLRLALKNEFGA